MPQSDGRRDGRDEHSAADLPRKDYPPRIPAIYENAGWHVSEDAGRHHRAGDPSRGERRTRQVEDKHRVRDV
jgi:hypothetical protein